MNDINWATLVANGRANAIGVPWTDEEAAARTAGIPADFVRQGVLDIEEYQKLQKQDDSGDEKPIARMTKPELLAKADELGLGYTPSVTVAALREIINNKLNGEVDADTTVDDSESDEDESK